MSLLLEKYSSIIEKSNSILERIKKTKAGLDEIKDNIDLLLPKRIENLEKTVEKIDEYELKITAFKNLAEQHIESKNLSTIEAPEGYRVNINRLKKWSLMIDPLSTNDPYAKRIYAVANCDLLFLKKKRIEFVERIELLKNADAMQGVEETAEMTKKLEALENEMETLFTSAEFYSFADAVINENGKYMHNEEKTVYDPKSKADSFVLGSIGVPMCCANSEQAERLHTLFGSFYDVETSQVYVPFEDINNSKEFGITVSCIPSNAKINELDAGVRNFLFNIIDGSVAGDKQVYILDGERQNSSLAGCLKDIEETFALEHIARNEEQLSSALETIVSSFPDIDDAIESYDSVIEYNSNVESEKQITRKTVVIFGWPNAFENNDKTLINKILSNYERYGVSFVLISLNHADNENAQKNIFQISEYIYENLYHIEMNGKETIFKYGDKVNKFNWYSLKGQLKEEYVDSIKAVKIENKTVGNKYAEHVDLVNLPEITREYQSITMPFGIESNKSQPDEFSFENENFAAFLEGASRSGKSTLIHVLIAGLIRKYHPDNLELWLADFKQLEFENYIKHLPPHVKYVLLDESAELVYDLIDKLTEKMMERQNIFAQFEKKKINEFTAADIEKIGQPMPVIFVIFDEFSIMSQQLSESESYKLKLQNLLAKGAALGIRFLFASQTFTSGVSGLTLTARAQIQQRIAMKGTADEISQTLELSAGLKTEQVRNWMAALPPHYALVKRVEKEGEMPKVKRFHVLYFDDYAERDALIERLNKKYKPVEEFTPHNIDTYVDKHPVLVDGKVYKAYNRKTIENAVAQELEFNPTDHTSDEIFVSFGVPRLMANIKLNQFTSESRENLLFIANSQEQVFCSSVITSVMDEFDAQNAKVNIWSYNRNRLYKANKNLASWSNPNYEKHDDLDSICDSIYDLKEKIINGEAGNELIVMLGFDRICSEFDFADGGASVSENSAFKEEFAESEKKRNNELVKKGVAVSSEAESLLITIKKKHYLPYANQYGKKMLEEGFAGNAMLDFAKKAPFEEFIENPDEIIDSLGLEREANFDETLDIINRYNIALGNYEEEIEEEVDDEEVEVEETGFYNASEDLKFIIKYGSRLGYHFVMVLNDYSDLRQTGIRPEMFRHKLSFQISKDDSVSFHGTRIASTLPEHVCQYTNGLDGYSFRPYVHKDINWDGWYVDDNGEAKNKFLEKEI